MRNLYGTKRCRPNRARQSKRLYPALRQKRRAIVNLSGRGQGRPWLQFDSDFAVEQIKCLLSSRGTLKYPKHEPLLEGAAERIHAAVRELKELGLSMRKGTAFARTSRKI